MSYKKAYSVLFNDPVIKEVIRVTGKLAPLPALDPYKSLLKSIISQQLSTKAASTIHSRFLDLFLRKNASPQRVLESDIVDFRNAGLSNAKSNYIKNVAQFAVEGKLQRSLLEQMEDEELILHLTQIKGVGKWTAEMIAMFSLQRDDVFPVDDLGIRNAIGKLYSINTKSKTFEKRAFKQSLEWSPYRTLACRHLWKWLDQ